jgi:3-keto-disaccharide hydrolase
MRNRIVVGIFFVLLCTSALPPRGARAAEDGKAGGAVELFNGKDLSNWTYVSKDANSKMEDVYSVSDGVIHDKGNPIGYIRTKEKYTSFKLHVEWRFPAKPGNSGVLLRVQEPDNVWPKSVECQLQSKNAGDIWVIDEFPIKTAPDRTEGRHVKKEHETNEKPLGEWNEYDITLDGGNLELKVNGLVQNTASDMQVIPGYILLQAEGAEIEFRKVTLTPIGDGKKADAQLRRLPGLEGWHIIGNGNWTYHDGIIEGQQTKAEKTYTHVVSDQRYKNLRATLMYKCLDGNSGFYFRSQPDDIAHMHGIQCEIDVEKDEGGFYESYGRNWLSQPKAEDVAKFYKPKEWNEMKVEAIGPHVTSWINGTKAAEITDDKQRMEGLCALQIHGGQDVHVMFKDIKIEDLGDSQ